MCSSDSLLPRFCCVLAQLLGVRSHWYLQQQKVILTLVHTMLPRGIDIFDGCSTPINVVGWIDCSVEPSRAPHGVSPGLLPFSEEPHSQAIPTASVWSLTGNKIWQEKIWLYEWHQGGWGKMGGRGNCKNAFHPCLVSWTTGLMSWPTSSIFAALQTLHKASGLRLADGNYNKAPDYSTRRWLFSAPKCRHVAAASECDWHVYHVTSNGCSKSWRLCGASAL